MPRPIDGALDEVNRIASKRDLLLDPLLPGPGDLSDGCCLPLVAHGQDGLPAGFGLCAHHVIPANSMAQTWGMTTRFMLTLRLAGPDTLPTVDLLLTRWREHLSGIREATADDTTAMVHWPSRDGTGVRALLRHGMQPIEVLAARPKDRATPAQDIAGVVIREAGPNDIESVTSMLMSLIAYEAQFGVSVLRPATAELVRGDAQAALSRRPSWTWLAERNGYPTGLVMVQPPQEATWITGMTGLAPAVYLYAGFVVPAERGSGTAAMLVRRAHDFLDAEGIVVTLLHYAQVNPASGPFWARMGYRPLWTDWEARPAAALR